MLTSFLAGQTLTAAALNALNTAITGVTPLIAIKAGNTSRASTSTLAADPELFVALTPSLTYVVDSLLMYDAGATGLFQCYWSVPAGATVVGVPWGLSTTVTANSEGIIRTVPTGTGMGANGSGNQVSARPAAYVVMGATAGNLSLTWAQQVSNATATVLHTGSWIRAIQIPT